MRPLALALTLRACRYAGIFGLSGSVGGQAEMAYLTATYGAVKFEVPRFLDTCTGTPRKQVSPATASIPNANPKPTLILILSLT